MKRELSKNRALCLWLPEWSLQRVRGAQPELRRRKIVLYGQSRGGFRVVASSVPRIPIGMPLTEASAIGSAHFQLHDPQADQAALLQLAAWCEQFSPIVGIEPPDNLCVNVTGLAPLFGGEHLLVQQVMRAFQRIGYLVRVAIADTIGAAWAVAHFDKVSPLIVPPRQTAEALKDLPIAALRVTDVTDLLAELGIERIGQLMALPRGALAERFDPQLLLRLNQALGLASEVVVAYRPLPEITVETELEYPTDNRQTVEVVLSQLIESIAVSLGERQQGAIRLGCKLDCEDGQPIEYVVGLFQASGSAKHLLALAQLQLDRITIPAPVVAVRLSVLTMARLQTRQQELFDPSQHEHRRNVSLLVDRLSNRLGREAVVRAVPQADAQPELAFWYAPLAGMAVRHTKQCWKLFPRPLRLENDPVRLDVISVVPEGPPMQFQFHGCHRIAQAWGPERIQTGWWRGRYVQRDYYRVETTTGRRFWLFRRLSDKQWFLHGVFN